MNAIKLFFILYILSVAFLYYVAGRAKGPVVLPGDIYRIKGANKIYIPFGSAFFLALILTILVNTLF